MLISNPYVGRTYPVPGHLRFSLKPFQANVVVHADGRAAICDFGLSTLLSTPENLASDTTPSTTLRRDNLLTGLTTASGGTPRYAPPEHFHGDGSPTLAADVYAFGCTCAEVGFNFQIS